MKSASISDPTPNPIGTPTVSKQLTEKYRPARLADLVGQGWIKSELEHFTAAPYPCAMIFAGDTGTGKSSAVRGLAADLGCPPSDFTVVKSGQLDGEMLEGVEIIFRYAPMHSGWRVIEFQEADMMTPKAERLFLSILEEIPPRTVVVFTTNRPEWFNARPRLRDRCELYQFAADAATLRQDADALAASIWAAEGGTGPAPTADAIPGAIEGDALSFRRVVAGLERILRRDPERFTLAPPKQAPPSLLGMCGPFGRKPGGTATPPADRTTGQRGALLVAIESIPLDDEPLDVEPIEDEPVDVEPLAEWTPPAPVAAREWAWGLPEGSPRPSVKSVATRFRISWDTARRVVSERWGFAEVSA
jgi:hypothetical protein